MISRRLESFITTLLRSENNLVEKHDTVVRLEKEIRRMKQITDVKKKEVEAKSKINGDNKNEPTIAGKTHI